MMSNIVFPFNSKKQLNSKGPLFKLRSKIRWFSSFIVLSCLALMSPAYGQLSDSDLANYHEIPATIVGVDLDAQELTLAELGRPTIVYRMAFGIKIQLQNGDPGTVSNLSEGDVITAIVDRKASSIHVVFVVGHIELNSAQNLLN